jgi:hypothetical protein
MPMTRQDVTLGEFVRQLALKFAEANVPMPFNDDQPWHELFYQMKKKAGPKPRFFDFLIFDWTGPAPRSRDLAEYLNSLHRIGCFSAENPSFDKVDVDPGVKNLWQQEHLDNDLNEYLGQAVEGAREIFPAA